MLVFYDFEVFYKDWLVVCIKQPANKKVVIINDVKRLDAYYKEHKNDIWVGFNSNKYDRYVLKGLLSGFDAYKITNYIIEKDKNGAYFNKAMNLINLYSYDVYKGLTDYSLKTLEGFMGNNIKESEVDFKIKRKLTDEEIEETIRYCTHDVEQLIEVFYLRKDDFMSHINMIKEFKLLLNNIDKTTAQLIAIILNAKRVERDDDYDIQLPTNLKLNKYQYVADFFLHSYDEVNALLINKYNKMQHIVNNSYVLNEIKTAKKYINEYENNYKEIFKEAFYQYNLTTDVAKCKHTFARGGVHGALKNYIYGCKDDEIIIMADVSSLYPSIMLEYDLLSRNVDDKEKFRLIYNTNIEMKANKDPRRPVYKLICNTTYGCMGDKYNNLYDKRNQNLVCVYGQLLILDLIEKLEPHIIQLIQSNTDGVAFIIKKKDFDLIDDIIYEWECRTHLSMEIDFYKKIIQKDVNNYILVDYNNEYKCKGPYVKKLTKLDNDLPIVNKALIEYFVNGIAVEKTINDCDDLIEFQKIYKLSKNYEFVWHNNKFYKNKSYRVFASKNLTDTAICKCKNKNATLEDFANTPSHCFIDNDDVNNKKVPSYLDKDYYINLSKKRIKQFIKM